MERDQAYSILARELEHYRRLPWADLVRGIGGPAIERTEWDGKEPLTIEIRFEWSGRDAGPIRIRATAYGSSSFRLESLEEAVLVHPPAVA